MPTSSTSAALQQAAQGVVYQSETDAPWTAFAWPAATGTPNPAAICQLGKHKPNAPVEEQGADEFFAPLLQDQDWFGDAEKADLARNRALAAAVKQHLQDPKVFKVGKRKKTIYVVGNAPEGGWAGLRTTAVET